MAADWICSFLSLCAGVSWHFYFVVKVCYQSFLNFSSNNSFCLCEYSSTLSLIKRFAWLSLRRVDKACIRLFYGTVFSVWPYMVIDCSTNSFKSSIVTPLGLHLNSAPHQYIYNRPQLYQRAHNTQNFLLNFLYCFVISSFFVIIFQLRFYKSVKYWDVSNITSYWTRFKYNFLQIFFKYVVLKLLTYSRIVFWNIPWKVFFN